MKPQDASERSEPSSTAQEPVSGAAPHTGSGAHTALQAMLKKRKSRAGRDTEPQTPAPDDDATSASDT